MCDLKRHRARGQSSRDATAASEPDVSSVTSALTALEIERVVDENPADVKDYGLDAPRIEIDFKATDGKASGRLLVGAKTPTGASMYARRNDEKRVFLVAEYQNASLNKSTFDLRDKSILKIDRDKLLAGAGRTQAAGSSRKRRE